MRKNRAPSGRAEQVEEQSTWKSRAPSRKVKHQPEEQSAL